VGLGQSAPIGRPPARLAVQAAAKRQSVQLRGPTSAAREARLWAE
jgi:hypothetical protein